MLFQLELYLYIFLAEFSKICGFELYSYQRTQSCQSENWKNAQNQLSSIYFSIIVMRQCYFRIICQIVFKTCLKWIFLLNLKFEVYLAKNEYVQRIVHHLKNYIVVCKIFVEPYTRYPITPCVVIYTRFIKIKWFILRFTFCIFLKRN